MGICDDGPYSLVAKNLAATGHIHYNGWSAAMLGGQLYLGAAFIKLFGFSFTTVRMSTLLMAVIMAWLLQRTLVRAGVQERNATIGTLALVLSPLYLMLSVTYMTDISGLFAVVLCLYGCLRALQSSTDRATIAWLCFAVFTNAVLGTSRQIAWLGVLVMVPSALYLLRFRRRILFAGVLTTTAGALFILACMLWLRHQPYTLPEHLVLNRGGEFDALAAITSAVLDLPFLLLPISALFLAELFRNLRGTVTAAALASFAYLLTPLAAYHWRGYLHLVPLLEPVMGDWVTKYGGYRSNFLTGQAPVFLPTGIRLTLTAASLGGLIGLLASLLSLRSRPPETESQQPSKWRHLAILLTPFTVVYSLLLIPRAASADGIFDRYLLELLPVALIWMLRYYQERIQPRMPAAALLLIAIWATYSSVVTHNMFSLYRARVALAAELRTNGLPDTSVDNGWEYNFVVEIRHFGHINESHIELPAHAYVPAPPPPAGACPTFWAEKTPHIRPLYCVSFDPNACYGPAPFDPVHYSRWPYRTPGTLYVVRYLPPKA